MFDLILSFVLAHPIVTILGTILVLFWLFANFVPNTQVGIVEKIWSPLGSVKSGIIALHGEAGYQPRVLRGGIHFLPPFQYAVHKLPLVTIPQGKIGYVFARDGQPLGPTQTLASNIQANNFEDVTDFLLHGGQRGPQRQILREGTYAINLAQFVVITEGHVFYHRLNVDEDRLFETTAHLLRDRKGFEPIVIRGADDQCGIITVHDGPSLGEGEIIAPVRGNDPTDKPHYHNNFQDAERFLLAGGGRGRQLQVLVEGTYFVNRLFATVEMIPKTVVEVGTVGVVVSYTGEIGADLTGDAYKHGELVKRGQRGVWCDPLLAGKYAFNTFAGKVVAVPTTNFILKWIRSEMGAHKFDENLCEVSLITRDAFEPSLPLSVVVHIDYKKAPLVIQRFGDIKKLVEQTLDPMVSAYFKNVGQNRTLIQLLQDRNSIQEQAAAEMKEKFGHYNLELEEVLIGTPGSSAGDHKIEEILTQLRSRQIAMEQIATYDQQQKAAVKERELREAESRARCQQKLTESELQITVQSNQGKADYQKAVQQAAQIRALAQAEAERSARVGVGQAIAIEEQVRAYGGPQFQLTKEVMGRFAEAIQQSRVDVVPKIIVGGSQGGNGSSGNVMEALLTMMLSDRLASGLTAGASSPGSPQAQAMRSQIYKEIATESQGQPTGPGQMPTGTKGTGGKPGVS